MKLQNAVGSEFYEELKKLYIRAFPENERMPVNMIEDKTKSGEAEILSISENKNFIGFAIMLDNGKHILLDYFAISENARGAGCGSKVIELLKERYSDKTIVIEIESPDNFENDIKLRRKNFYLRNGAKETGIKVSLFEVKMELLVTSGEITFEDYINIYGDIFGEKITRNIRNITDFL